MQWGLINTAPMDMWMWVDNVWTEVNCIIGTIVNIISYDGESPYELPANTKLEQVPDDANIGDTGY